MQLLAAFALLAFIDALPDALPDAIADPVAVASGGQAAEVQVTVEVADPAPAGHWETRRQCGQSGCQEVQVWVQDGQEQPQQQTPTYQRRWWRW